ncbi:MAG TPA: chemotaxis protein, partial [Pelotomaculum sp.]|nr:chemotaxis protein [Pelotomaculum sp.]
YNGDFNELKNNLNACIDAVNGLLKEVNHMVRAVKDGKLDTRSNASAFAGEWGKLLSDMNGLMAAVDEPVNELMTILSRVAVNDVTQ